MKTTKANTEKNVTANILNAKTINAIRAMLLDYKDSFANAVRMMHTLATEKNEKSIKRVCDYLGINAESIRSKNLPTLRKNVLDRIPLYYCIEGSDTHFPARLQKINKNAKIDAFIAVPESYINALLELAKKLSEGNVYDCKQVEITSVDKVDAKENGYTLDNVAFTAYDKNAVKIEVDKQKYVDYLNNNRAANQVGTDAKSAFWSGK